MRSAIPHLRKRADFLRVAATRRRWTTHGVVLQIAPRPADTGDAPRVGYTASRKVGNAVVRNRTRRRLREAARLLLRERPVHGMDLVLVGRDATRSRPFALLVEDLRRALDKVGAR